MHADSALPFEEPHDICHAETGRDAEYHVNVVRFGSAFDHLDVLLPQELSDDLPDALSYLAIQLFLSVFGNDDHVVNAFPSHVGIGICSGHGKRRVTLL